MAKEGNPFCRDCYNKLFRAKCKYCSQSILSVSTRLSSILRSCKLTKQEFYTIGEDRYHPDCFRCMRCARVLEGGAYVDRGTERLCVHCVTPWYFLVVVVGGVVFLLFL